MFVVIDANRKEMKADEILDLLKITCSIDEIEELSDFCAILKQFIEENGRIPSLPNDLDQLLKKSSVLCAEDLVYLIENCTKFVLIESPIDNNSFDFKPLRQDQNILKEFKFAAILSAEIQKIVTRKYLPEVKTINV